MKNADAKDFAELETIFAKNAGTVKVDKMLNFGSLKMQVYVNNKLFEFSSLPL